MPGLLDYPRPVPMPSATRGLLDMILAAPGYVGNAFSNMASQGLLANEAFLQGRGTDGEDLYARPFLPGADTGGRLGALSSFLNSNMALGGPAGTLGAGPSMPKRYEYRMMYRPPSNATVPPGFAEFGPVTRENPFGTVIYDKPIPFKAESQFELWPLDRAHPKNIAKEFDDFKSKFSDQFSNAGERYRGSDFSVTPSTSQPDTWQLTQFSKDGAGNLIPAGHLDITDFDELTREVWRRQRLNNNSLANALRGNQDTK